MRCSSALFLGLLVVMASCGSSPDVPADTDDVATEPPAETPSEVVVVPSAPLPPAPTPTADPATKIGFAGGNRFIVFAQEREPSFSVVDIDRGETFRVLGTPIGEASASANRFMEMGLANGAPHWGLEGDREGRILVRSVGGVQLVDLAERGRMIAAWRGEPLATSIAPDGRTFSVATGRALHIVRASDGAFATFPFTAEHERGLVPSWGDANVHWVSGDTLTRVDRETLAASVVRAPAARAQFAASSDATVVAVAAEGSVSVHVAGIAAPVLQITSPEETAQLTVDRDGTNVVWIERVIDEKLFTDKGHLHSIDVATRTHVRFPMTNSGCANAPETIEAVREGEIITDPSCSIGCPSVRWTHRSVAYDAHTGKIVRDSSTTETQSWNEEQGALHAAVERAATRLGIETSAMLNVATGTTFVVERPSSDLALTELTPGSVPIALEASKAASVQSLTFSADGAVIAGVVAGRMRAWDGVTGRALLR